MLARTSDQAGPIHAPPAVVRVPSLEAIFTEHAAFVWRALRRLGVGERDVEDVCQEVFLIAHRKLPSFEGRSSIRTWIYGIAVRVASDHKKLARHRREEVTDAPPEQAVDAPQIDAIGERQARALLDGALAELDQDKRAVFVLFELEELPMTEVAEAVGCPLQTAYARLYAARRSVTATLRRAAGERIP